MKITSATVVVLIHQLEEAAKAKGWTLNKKAGGSVPVHKCPKCGRVSVITFTKERPNGREIFDVCIHNKINGTERCNMLCHLFVRIDKWNVPKYKPLCAALFVPYGVINTADGISVIKYR
jgi:hypothetical protein